MKLPQAPSPASEKGTAMHEAISNIWKEQNKSLIKIQEILKGMRENTHMITYDKRDQVTISNNAEAINTKIKTTIALFNDLIDVLNTDVEVLKKMKENVHM